MAACNSSSPISTAPSSPYPLNWLVGIKFHFSKFKLS
ncbi:hypothetical protein GYH30_039760 [Glycine max]|nr:hypothetical protein GYH30_039760 [Glycine max]